MEIKITVQDDRRGINFTISSPTFEIASEKLAKIEKYYENLTETVSPEDFPF